MYTEFLIPFFFAFAIVYGALEVSGVIKNNRANLIIALVMGFFAVSNPMVTGFINAILPYAVILFIAVFFIGFVTSFFRGKEGKGGDYTLLAIIAGLALIFLSSGNSPLEGLSLSGSGLVPWIVLALIVLIFVAAYYRAPQAGQ